MKLRCPFCKTVFPALDAARCPACGKTLRMPESTFVDARKTWRTMRNPKGKAPRQKPPMLMVPWLIFAARPRRMVWSLALAGAVAAMLLLTRVQTAPGGTREPAKVTRARAELEVLRTALEWFCSSCRRYPTDAEGLRALVRDPGVPGWDGHYIEGLPPDPWGRQYVYACSNTTVTLFSLGPDGKTNTVDDISAPPPDFKALMERIIPPDEENR